MSRTSGRISPEELVRPALPQYPSPVSGGRGQLFYSSSNNLVPTISQLITTRETADLAAIAAQSTVCQCGRPKGSGHLFCPRCSRYSGPFVVVQSPSGDYTEFNGIESAEAVLAQHDRKASMPSVSR